MRLLDILQRRFGRYAVPHVTEGLIVCQVLTYFFSQNDPAIVEGIALVPRRVLEGDVWRLASFLATPPVTHPIFALFFWYVFYLMGTALENAWGAFRYNVYLTVGWLATAAAAFAQPDAAASVGFLQGSVFLAFAYLYPDFQLLLFFILPVKMKWLAWLAWLGYLAAVALGPVPAKLMALASVCNFALFFWADILARMRSRRRRRASRVEQARRAAAPRHTCVVCGATNLSDPDLSFRYCSKCDGSPCYCEKHLHSHQHRVEQTPAPAAVEE